jgi:N4-gp56 family major capsid protein
MAAGQHTYASAGGTQLTAEARTYYSMELIERLLSQLILLEDGEKKTIPLHTGGFGSGEIQWRKYTISTALTASSDEVAQEGAANSAVALSVATVTTNLKQYVAHLKVTDVLQDAGIDNTMQESVQLIGERMGRAMHLVTIAGLESGASNVTFGGAATSIATLTTADLLNSTVLKKVVRELERRNVPRYPDGFWRAAIHPDQAYDLRNDSQWRNVGEYNGGKAEGGGPNVLTGELGMLHGIRFRETTDLTQLNTGGAGGNVPYARGFVYGPRAWGVLDFASMPVGKINPETQLGVRVDMELPGKSSKADLHGQWGFVGAKVAFACKVIDANMIQGLTTAVSA